MRACIAYIVARIAGDGGVFRVYDQSRSTHVNLGATVNGTRIGLYDYDRRCNVFGTLPSLWDEGTGANVTLEIDGCNFRGRDGSSGGCFTGSVNGSTIVMRDEAEAADFTYTLEQMSPPWLPQSAN